jgi:hypothetical protein
VFCGVVVAVAAGAGSAFCGVVLAESLVVAVADSAGSANRQAAAMAGMQNLCMPISWGYVGTKVEEVLRRQAAALIIRFI